MYSGELDIPDSLEDLDLLQSPDEGFRCVFSTTEVIKVGTGTTTRKHDSKQYCFVEQKGDDQFSVQSINSSHLPFGESETITLEELTGKYVPEVEFFENNVLPAMTELADHLDEGDKHRQAGRLYSAEGSYNMALAMDEENVRALFGLGLVYLKMDNGKARDMMHSILKVKAAFDGKNQHLFNEFGISLRKAEMFDDAVRYYAEAIRYTDRDENLFYNLARANYERNDWEACTEALCRCHELNPKMKAAIVMARGVLRMAKKPDSGDSQVPHSVAARIRSVLDVENTPERSVDVPGMSFSPTEETAGGKSIKRARRVATK